MTDNPNQVNMGLLMGGVFGSMFSIFLFNSGHQAMESLTMALGRGPYYRMMKLMVEYHDERAKASGTSPNGKHA
jgi:hypothetical protein